MASGQDHDLIANDPPNHLHGGEVGFDKKVWKAERVKRSDKAPSVRLRLVSPDGDLGYRGTVHCSLTYTVTCDNAFVIDIEVRADRATPVNLTHHSYFNLAGEENGSIEDHELQVHADFFVPSDSDLTLLGRLEGTPDGVNDFQTPRRLSKAIPKLLRQHGPSSA